MKNTLWRIALIVGGAFLLVVNFSGPDPAAGSPLAPTNAAQQVGYYLAKAGIAALALWFIYRGIRPRQRQAGK